nr:MAG TPA_asm: putative lipoprotein [Caudoviricetes sp.]
MEKIKVSVHSISHRLEWKGWGNFSPALRATDYKCPHCILREYE